jgi:serine phosphatase RsbU (regulator of sigma subunit)
MAGQALGYSRAHEVVVKHERMERHLNAARTVQLSMLPRETPQTPEYRFCNHYVAAERVGGDYYFYETLGNGQIVFGIADASGKGLAASMQIVRFAGEVRLRIATSRTLKVALEKLNQFVCSFGDTRFITCCICVLDPAKHQLTLANAGHLYPLWYHADSGTVEKVVTPNGGLPLGLDPHEKFHPTKLSLQPGDRFFLYTDGVSEAMNMDLEQYSTDRLVKLVASSRDPLPQLIQAIEKDVTQFRNGQDASDDVCVIGLERLPVLGRLATP